MMEILGILIAVAAACAALVVLARPHLAFVLLMVMFPLKQLLQTYIPFVANYPVSVNIAIGLLVLFATLTRFMRRELVDSGYLNRVTVLVAILYFLWLVGIVYSPSRDVMWTYIERLPTDALYLGLLLFFMPLLVQDVFEFRRALYGLMLVGSLICVLIMVNPASVYWSGRLVLDLGMLATGRDIGNALATASLGAMTALVAALIRPAHPSFMITALRIGAFIAGMGMAIGSDSRGQVLAAAIVGIIFFPMSRKLANPKQFFVVIIGFIVLVAGLLMVFQMFVSDVNRERWNPIDMLVSTTMRLEMVWRLFEYYLSSPMHWLFGLGTGAYASISLDTTVARDYVHNIAAEVLCEHGLVGAALFIAMIIILFKQGRRLWSMYSDDPVMRSTIALLAAICVFTLLESLKQGSMHYPAPFFWWVILAKLATREELVRASEEQYAPEEDALEYEYGTVDYGDAPAHPA